jgi:hypothetical protein
MGCLLTLVGGVRVGQGRWSRRAERANRAREPVLAATFPWWADSDSGLRDIAAGARWTAAETPGRAYVATRVAAWAGEHGRSG